MTGYAEFAVTTNFSFLRGASHGEELVLQGKALGLAGIGVADRNSVAGVVRAHQAAKEAGLAFAPGTRLMFCDGTPDILAYPESRAAWGRLTTTSHPRQAPRREGRMRAPPRRPPRPCGRAQPHRHAGALEARRRRT